MARHCFSQTDGVVYLSYVTTSTLLGQPLDMPAYMYIYVKVK